MTFTISKQSQQKHQEHQKTMQRPAEVKCYFIGYLCETTNRCSIYWSSGRTLALNYVNDWPYRVFFRDNCL